ncbi:oligosaccharide repeat unit polymerase [compost metagenome]
MFLCAGLLFASIWSFYPGNLEEFILLWGVFLLASGYLLLQKTINLFEPFYLFSAYYLTFIFSAVALRFGGFENNAFISNTTFYNNIEDTFSWCVLYISAGYLFALIGYRALATNRIITIDLIVAGKHQQILKLVAYALFFSGMANFSYNVITLYSGNIIEYYKNISMRLYDFKDGGTTLGYHFIYIAVYILFLIDLDRKKISLSTYALVFAAVAVFASQGRIFQTLTFIMSFVVLYYYSMGAARLNARMVLLGFGIAVSGLVFYLLRYASSLSYNQGLGDYGGLASFLAESFTVDNLLNFSVGMGNLPNFAVLMKVVDSWSRDIGYMWGLTLLYPLADFMPSFFDEAIGMPAVLTKNQWYEHVAGGTLPVTGIGEMYLNFGIAGPVLGMFLFGSLGASIYNFAARQGSNIFLIFYAKFAVGFFMLYPKGEFNNFGFLWMAIHPFSIWLLIKFLDRLHIALVSRSTVS